ncbi:MAG: gliding motility-associated C-terminal domain-containing protein [Chitinophagaceae bacterium]
MSFKTGIIVLVLFLCLHVNSVLGQNCTTLGQTPSTAFPVCGTNTFHQNTVPVCGGTTISGPCNGVDGIPLSDQNPYWYQFTCFNTGTLGFKLTPANLGDDYDWQLFDITGHNPNDVFTDATLFVSCNWSGSTGITGASSAGTQANVCATSPQHPNRPLFSSMPTLTQGHTYLLLISHFAGDNQSGYDLAFGGGSAVITDPKEPHMDKATASCDGRQIRLKLNKKMKCNSITVTGSEFSIVPAVATVTAAEAVNCTSSFDFDEITLTLSNALPAGNFQLLINPGTDNNSLVDNCDRGIPDGEQAAFNFFIPTPIPIDSVAGVGCAPDQIKLHFSKKINCSTIAANGSNFLVSGPTPVTVTGASGDCTDGLSDIITVKFNSPIFTKGTYTVTPKLSVNGGAVVDECGQIIQPLPVNFTTADTVSAAFTYNNNLGCRFNILTFSHDGAHNVNNWKWIFNSTQTFNTPSHTITLPASSTTTVQLTVSNGVCTDTANETIVLDNEVKAGFDMPEVICPEDKLVLVNTSTGLINTWRWNYTIGTSSLETPQPIQFPTNNIETFYTIKLVATNTTIGCSDSLSKQLKVLDNCFIAVPSAFTPNGDGLNDYLFPNNALKAIDLEFKVFNRWGQLVFESRNWQEKWNGKIGGIPQTSGVYVWFLKYTRSDTGKKVFQKGTTTLIR